MELALTIALFAGAAVWLAFSAWYMIRATWWKSAFGWNTLGVSLALTVILTRLAVLYLVPSVTADLKFTGLLFYVAIAILGAQRLVLLEKAQRQTPVALRNRRSGDAAP